MSNTATQSNRKSPADGYELGMTLPLPPAEEWISMARAGRYLKIDGKPPGNWKTCRAITRGTRTPSGHRIFLAAWRIGRRTFTTEAAVKRYIAEINGRRPDARIDRPDTADAELRAFGVCI